MRVLFDVTHPAHVHLFRPLARRIADGGGEVLFVGRRKDVTVDLLESFSLPFRIPTTSRSRPGRSGDVVEFVQRAWSLRQMIAEWDPAVLLTRNPVGAVAGFGTRTWSVFDTDDGRTVGAHYWTARPFADVITSSVHDPEDHGPRHRRYRSLKALGFLSAQHFSADPSVRERYGIPDGALSVVRLSRHEASHDRRITGIDAETREALLRMLAAAGHVILSEEGRGTLLYPRAGQGPGGSAGRVVRPEDFHALLAESMLCVGDSQSVAAEAAVLGVPSVRLSGFTGRTFYLGLLEERYGLIRNLSPGEEREFLDAVRTVLDDPSGARSRAQKGADRLHAESEDLVEWFLGLISELGTVRKRPFSASGRPPRIGWTGSRRGSDD